MDYPKISIVTPSYNLALYLEQTILSIVQQEYPNLEYIIIDGGSTDGSVEIIKKYEQYLSYWVSEPDNVLYYALQKGFEQATGDIMGWLNADDLLHPKALFTLGSIFRDISEVQWLQGYPTVFDKAGRVVSHRPPQSSKYSFYLKQYHNGKFIQQESTYWRRSLWEKTGEFVSSEYKLAGDFELWMRFFQHEVLYNTSALIGGFRVRVGEQLSQKNHEAYLEECDRIVDSWLTKLDKTDNKIIAYAHRANKLGWIPKKSLLLPWYRQYLQVRDYVPSLAYDHRQERFFLVEH